MKLNRFIFIFMLTLVTISCKKKDAAVEYGPCGEEPIGIDPLNWYSVQFGVGLEGLSDAIDVIWPKDSVKLYDSFENEININWGEDVNGHSLSDPIYFFNFSEDTLAFDSIKSDLYFIDFHENNYVDRDTIEIRYKVLIGECGQILDPLEFYHNQMLIENYGYITSRRINLIK